MLVQRFREPGVKFTFLLNDYLEYLMKYRSLVKCIAGKREFRLWNEKPGDLWDQRKLSQQNSQKCAKHVRFGFHRAHFKGSYTRKMWDRFHFGEKNENICLQTSRKMILKAFFPKTTMLEGWLLNVLNSVSEIKTSLHFLQCPLFRRWSPESWYPWRFLHFSKVTDFLVPT